MVRIPSHALLRSFECAARHQSYTRAAEELHLTQSAISRQVKELELATGLHLFRRSGRNVVLTNAGRNLAKELTRDLRQIQQTMMRAISAGDDRTSLTIATLPTFANRWLIPRLPDFVESNPEIEINLHTRLEPFDLSKEQFDLAIHYGTLDWPDTRMVKLCDEQMFPVASPQFKSKYNIEYLSALEQAPLLHLASRQSAWSDWFSMQGMDNKKHYPGKRFDQFSMVISATLASLGAALLPDYLIETELADGRLIRLNDIPFESRNSYFLASPNGYTNKNAQKFEQWIRERITKSRSGRTNLKNKM